MNQNRRSSLVALAILERGRALGGLWSIPGAKTQLKSPPIIISEGQIEEILANKWQ